MWHDSSPTLRDLHTTNIGQQPLIMNTVGNMFESSVLASTSRVSVASNESGFYDMSSPDADSSRSTMCDRSAEAMGLAHQQRPVRRTQKRLKIVNEQCGVAPPPSKQSKQIEIPKPPTKSVLDTLGAAQRDAVWPQPDVKLTLNDRVLRLLTQREQATTPMLDYCARIQREVKPYMRRIVVEWMTDVCNDARIDIEVLPLAVNYLDRFLSVEQIYQTQLQALATACMWLASKIKMPKPFDASKLCQYTDAAVEMGPLMSWELLLLGRLNWDVASVTCIDFIEPFLARMRLPLEVANEIRVASRQVIYMMVKEYSLCSLPASMQTAICLSIVSRYCIQRPILLDDHTPLAYRVHNVVSQLIHMQTLSIRLAADNAFSTMQQHHSPPFAVDSCCSSTSVEVDPAALASSATNTPPRSPESLFTSMSLSSPPSCKTGGPSNYCSSSTATLTPTQ